MTRRRLHLAAAGISMAISTLAAAQPDASGSWVMRTLPESAGAAQYVVRLPADHSDAARWPMILFLHGSGESGSDAMAPTRVGIGSAIRAHPERWPCVVVFPQKPTINSEWWEHEAMVLATADDAMSAFAVDPERVTITGLSQGGAGTWTFAARHPARWKAAAPVCGYGMPLTVVTRLESIDVWAFHGEVDNIVDCAQTRRMIDTLLRHRAGKPDRGSVRATYFPGVGHNSWDQAYADPELAAFLVIK